jgi:xylan 1,4-beta-xylosidase
MIQKKISIDLAGEVKPFKHFFKASGYANADFTYTPSMRRMYDYLASYDEHPEFMRLHNIMSLHGKGDYYKFEMGIDYGNPEHIMSTKGVDSVVSIDKEGKLAFNWEVVDKVYDIIQAHDMRPIVEMVFMPSAIAKDVKEKCIPYDYKLYAQAVEAFVSHWVGRYGIEEVAKWYFEVINEPDNYDVFNDDPNTFMALYDYFEKAVHSVNSILKVGGPAVKQWKEGKRLLELFLAHCSNGVNYCSGTFGTKVDFISVHCKGGFPTWIGPQMNYMFDTLKEYASMIKAYPCFEKTEFLNDESDIVWQGNQGVKNKSWLNFRNTEYAPGFMCKMMNTYCDVIEDEYGMNLAIVDSDNSHLPWESFLFSGNRSQMTPLGNAPCTDIIKKPMFNAGQLLGRLGTERYLLKVEDEEFGIKYGVLPTRFPDGSYAVMVWNFEDGLTSDVNPREITLQLDNLDANAIYDVLQFRIDDSHSNAYNTWRTMGKPFPVSLEQIVELRKHDGLELCEPCYQVEKMSSFYKTVNLPMHAVSLFVLAKKTAQKDEEVSEITWIKATGEKGVNGNDQVFLNWKYSKRKDLVGYRLYQIDTEKGTKRVVNPEVLASTACYTDSAVTKGTYTYCVSSCFADGSESSCSDTVTVTV